MLGTENGHGSELSSHISQLACQVIIILFVTFCTIIMWCNIKVKELKNDTHLSQGLIAERLSARLMIVH